METNELIDLKKDHVDKIMAELSKDKINSMPFYFSDMVPHNCFL